MGNISLLHIPTLEHCNSWRFDYWLCFSIYVLHCRFDYISVGKEKEVSQIPICWTTYWPIGARLKYALLFFIGYSPKMNKKVIYAYQHLSNTETKKLKDCKIYSPFCLLVYNFMLFKYFCKNNTKYKSCNTLEHIWHYVYRRWYKSVHKAFKNKISCHHYNFCQSSALILSKSMTAGSRDLRPIQALWKMVHGEIFMTAT